VGRPAGLDHAPRPRGVVGRPAAPAPRHAPWAGGSEESAVPSGTGPSTTDGYPPGAPTPSATSRTTPTPKTSPGGCEGAAKGPRAREAEQRQTQQEGPGKRLEPKRLRIRYIYICIYIYIYIYATIDTNADMSIYIYI
jgi:hypothetical protein